MHAALRLVVSQPAPPRAATVRAYGSQPPAIELHSATELLLRRDRGCVHAGARCSDRSRNTGGCHRGWHHREVEQCNLAPSRPRHRDVTAGLIALCQTVWVRTVGRSRWPREALTARIPRKSGPAIRRPHGVDTHGDTRSAALQVTTVGIVARAGSQRRSYGAQRAHSDATRRRIEGAFLEWSNLNAPWQQPN